MAVCARRTRPSSHGPPPKPPITGMETARTTAGPATGPECLKSRSEAPGFADNQHFLDGYFRVCRVPPEIQADGVAHRYEIHPGAIRDPRDLGVPGDHADDLATVALHLPESGNRQIVFHRSISPKRCRRGA